MEYLNVENWELIRSLIGVLICLVSVLYIKKQNTPDFNKTLGREFSNKTYQKIKKQVQRLKEENERAQKLLAKMNNTSSLVTDTVKNKQRKAVKKARQDNTTYKRGNNNRSFGRKAEVEHNKSKNPYEQVRLLVASGMSKEEIYDNLDIPTAEIDLMLKFSELSKASQIREQTGTSLRAYG